MMWCILTDFTSQINQKENKLEKATQINEHKYHNMVVSYSKSTSTATNDMIIIKWYGSLQGTILSGVFH